MWKIVEDLQQERTQLALLFMISDRQILRKNTYKYVTFSSTYESKSMEGRTCSDRCAPNSKLMLGQGCEGRSNRRSSGVDIIDN